jgi:hypothetical protein
MFLLAFNFKTRSLINSMGRESEVSTPLILTSVTGYDPEPVRSVSHSSVFTPRTI